MFWKGAGEAIPRLGVFLQADGDGGLPAVEGNASRSDSCRGSCTPQITQHIRRIHGPCRRRVEGE